MSALLETLPGSRVLPKHRHGSNAHFLLRRVCARDGAETLNLEASTTFCVLFSKLSTDISILLCSV